MKKAISHPENSEAKGNSLKLKAICIITFLICINSVFAQFTIPEIPKFQTSVYDYANILKANEKAALEEKLIKYSDSTTTQIVVITIESLKGEDIGILTPKWGHKWGIGGTKKDDNGVLILLAKKERKIWISAGYGLEDRLTAGIGGEITRNIIIPEFKTGNFYKGLDKGTDAIIDVFKGKYKGERKPDEKEDDFPIIFVVIFILIILILVSKNKNNGGKNGNQGGGPDLFDILVLSSLGRNSGGFGSGSSGGSFGGGGGFGGGFGGGGFSGGGSGGSW
ncbi:MAG: TPM domain-containing protein [Flavobacterium sp.]